jgi:hypothetical protein
MKINTKSGQIVEQWNNLRPLYIQALARPPQSQNGRSSHDGTFRAIG